MALTKIYEDHNTDLFPFYYFIDNWVYLPKVLKNNVNEKVILFKEGTVHYHIDSENYAAVGKEIYELIFKKGGAEKIGRVIGEKCSVLLQLSGHLKSADFGKMSEEQLIEEYEKYDKLMRDLNDWGTLYGAMEFGENNLTTAGLKEAISDAAEKNRIEESPEEAVGILMASGKETFIRKEKRDVLLLAKEVEEQELKGIFDGPAEEIGEELKEQEEISEKLRELKRKYEWINYGYQGPAMGTDYFIAALKQALQNGVEKKLEEFENESEELEKKQKSLEERLQLNEELRNRFRVLRELSYQKIYRKEVQFCAFHAIEKLQSEIAKRTGLSLRQLRYFLFEEVLEAIEGKGKLDANIANERMEMCVYHFLNGKHELYSGKEARAWMEKLPKEKAVEEVNELKGHCACPGNVRGRVRVIMNANEIGKMQEGEVLVSFSTNPQMVPGMGKAAAIITDQGGVTCHAAIVSRELKIPCVIGTKIATKVLRDGDLVEVDASNGIVRKL